ncbi:MAG: acyltransferase [Lachnospiraceae bacterium]|nr:acyltransferase [Lachnospiraceae bacterium]
MTDVKKDNRNHLIEVYRCILSFLVVLTHCGLQMEAPGRRWIWSMIETSMPLFFMISGYFLYSPDESRVLKGLKKRAVKMAKLTAGTIGAYYVILFIMNYLTHDMETYLNNYCTPKVFFNMIFVNIPEICQPMWFLISMTYALAFMYLAAKKGLLDILCRCVPVLLAVNLLLSGNFNRFLPVQFDGFYARFFLFFAMPFLLMGYMVHRHQEKILSSVSPGKVICIILLTEMISGIEAELIGVNPLLLFMIPSAFFTLILALHFPQIGKGSIMEKIGTRNSLHIYLIHRILILGIWKLPIYGYLPDDLIRILSAVIIFTAAVILSESYLYVTERMKGRRKERIRG